MTRNLIALALGLAGLAWIFANTPLAHVGHDLLAASWAVLPMAGVHLSQLAVSAWAWREAMRRPPMPFGKMFFARWIREGVNSLLPVAQIGGQVVGARLLMGFGLPATLAAAGAILDVTLEAVSQLIFTLAGVVALLALRPDHAWVAWVGGGLVLTTAGVAGFVAVQRLGGMRLVESLLDRLAQNWPSLAGWSLAGLHAELMRLQAGRASLARATALHTVSWAMGGAEIFVALHVLGHAVGPAEAAIIESLGMAARSAGFAVPGALGIQEGGFILVCGLFGVPQEAALALSALKRLRELAVGLPALIVWRLRNRAASGV